MNGKDIMNSRYTGYLFCALAMVGVGSTVVVSRPIAVGLPPFTATVLRFAIALPLFVLVMRRRGVRWPRLSRRDAWPVIAQGGAGSVGYTVLLISGMKLASAADAGVIAGTLPAVSAVVAMIALGERPGVALLGTIALATTGVLICTVHVDDIAGPQARHSLVGNALVFAAIVCEALFILLNRKLRTPVDPLPLSALMCGVGLMVAIVPACLERPWTYALDIKALGGVLYYALVPTVAGFVLWYAGARRISGAEAGLMTALVPVNTVALAALVLREAVSAAQLTGVVCVLGVPCCWPPWARCAARARQPEALSTKNEALATLYVLPIAECPGLPTIDRNSRRVDGSVRNVPSMRDVTMLTPALCTPRVDMHWCAASRITPTPAGCNTSFSVSAICTVIFSWICRRLAKASTSRASFEMPTTRWFGRYATCARPMIGTM
ncbi:MAG: Permease of the drug/metabolite transporter (DMT) superfamily [uncultured Paraburkholderia sp.]|nr:MAG: Permease of the drug/metabolite transporter (DMT) superfamily [uncultured Paraburkholderia sp.]CAH2911967.1 MAG: Permease of the drug/metabolite transporter (DMT) superfamily [uncultured Paraburkholderia sp.]